jgi:histidinol-phosphate/aromatic aminotransferase/cobyric acid decarboxylase-like protein/imidazoleglycerol phosphate dehydratase HisB
VKALSPEFSAYTWSAPTAEVARLAGVDPSQVVRYDQNTPPLPLPSTRPGAVAGALAGINGYPAGGYVELRRAIAGYTGVDPDQIVLGVGADDLILLCARCFAGPGDTIAIPAAPTYPLYRIATLLAGAEVGDGDPVLTFTCRPSSPTGELRPMPSARPLVVDEAYFEYCGETAIPLLDEGVIVLRTFSKLFGLAGARIGYALASREVAAELNARQAPAPVSTVSAALAIAALASPPDVGPVIEERERLASALSALGLEPLPSLANFLFVPVDDGRALGDALLRQGLVVRAYDGGIRITIRDQPDDDLLVEALARQLAVASPVPAAAGRRVRHLRATAETRIAVRLGLDGASRVTVQTGGGIYDHFLEQLAFHGGLDLVVEASGDLETGDHHTVEDTALAFGEALDAALGDRSGIARYGDAVVPMDDALARAAVDLGGRPFAELSFEAEPGMAAHFFTSLAQAARMAIHIEATGRDAHHTAEAAYKAAGRALKTALRQDSNGIPSTKGLL